MPQALRQNRAMNSEHLALTAPVTGLYVGRAQRLPNDSRTSAILKQRVEGPLRVTALGLEGDEQADRRVHGGPEKALHHYPAVHYARLREKFEDLAPLFAPGAIGENISTDALDDAQVRIGDLYALGSARVQLSQPRTPCWKIDARFGLEGIAQFVERQGLAGWYYRVIEEGIVQVGDELRLLDRSPDALTLRVFNGLSRAHRPNVVDLLHAANQPGLSSNWAEKLRARARWLHDQSGARSPLADG